MIKGVVFDVGGTMHVSAKNAEKQHSYAETVIRLLAEAGFAVHETPEAFYEKLHQAAETYKAWSEQSGRELPGESIWNDYFLKPFALGGRVSASLSERLSFLHDAARQQLDPRPGLKETMRELSQMGLIIGVISNIISRDFIPGILKKYGIDGYMSCTVLSSVTGIRKPQPGIFRVAEQALHLKPEELAYVGDTISRDVIGTRNAGWRLMIQISNPRIAFRDTKVQHLGYRPDYRIESLTEIPAIISSENNKESSSAQVF